MMEGAKEMAALQSEGKSIFEGFRSTFRTAFEESDTSKPRLKVVEIEAEEPKADEKSSAAN